MDQKRHTPTGEETMIDAREKQVEFVAYSAAALVVAGNMKKYEAIEAVIEWLRRKIKAGAAPTDVPPRDDEFPWPSAAPAHAQVEPLARQMMDEARYAVEFM